MTWSPRRALAATVTSLLLVVVPASSFAQERQIAMGVAMLPSRDIGVMDAFTASVGDRSPALWTLWVSWGGADNELPSTDLLDDIVDRGAMPMINWEPVNPSNLESIQYRYKKINEGAKDDYIRGFAQDAAAWGKPLLLRFAHEMNGDWFPWGIGRFDNTAAGFKAAWRRIRTIFIEEGATNVKFLWSPYLTCGWCTPYSRIYPGDAYVDFVGFSAFNWNRPGLPWISMKKLYTKPVADLKAVAPKKKIIVAETGSSNKGGDKPAWIRTGYRAVYDAFPKIRAIIWFNIKITDHPDWRITKPLGALAEYTDLASLPRFQGRLVPPPAPD